MPGVRGCYGELLDREIVVEKIKIADSNMMKIIIFWTSQTERLLILGASRDRWNSFGVMYNAFGMIRGDFQKSWNFAPR